MPKSLLAAVVDAITDSMNEPDAAAEARSLIRSLKESGFKIIRTTALTSEVLDTGEGGSDA